MSAGIPMKETLSNIVHCFVGFQNSVDEKHFKREWIRRSLVYYEEVTRGDLPGLLLSPYCPQVVATTPVFISPARYNVGAPL